MNERRMQSFFGEYLRKNPPNQPEVYELKYTKGTSLGFSSVKEHQIQALLDAEDKGIYHKISDSPIFQGMKTRYTFKKPFDCLFVKGHSFVVVWFYKIRQPKFFYKIPVKEFIALRDSCGRKSITEEMAKEIGITILCK